MPKLVYRDSEAVDKVLSLAYEPILIGRATECQVRTDDAMVSRKHARIVWDGNYWVEDLDSANGVFVGSEKVTRAPFRPGDIVTCGSLVLRLLPETGPLPARALTPAKRITPEADALAGRGEKGVRTQKFEDLLKEAQARISAAEARAAILEAGAEESVRLKRKVEKLDAELKRMRDSTSGADTLSEADDTAPDANLLDEAGAIIDHLAEVKASLRAASDEGRLLKQPRESVVIVRDNLKHASAQLELAREQLRMFLKRFGVD